MRKAQEDLEKEAKRKEEERVNAINELVPPLDIDGYDEGECAMSWLGGAGLVIV